MREEFAKGNDFCQKITYKTTGKKPEEVWTDPQVIEDALWAEIDRVVQEPVTQVELDKALRQALARVPGVYVPSLYRVAYAPDGTLDRIEPEAPEARLPVLKRIVPRLPRENLLVEPCPRNTAPCVGLAALHVQRRDPRGVMAMLPADHHVARPGALREALAAGAQLAAAGALATIGIRPDRPETGYGYIRRAAGAGPVGAAGAAGRAQRVAPAARLSPPRPLRGGV